METINNVASAAAKAVWGQQEAKQEPISGVKGNTAQGEPYDAGNMEPDQVHQVATPGEETNQLKKPDASAIGKSELERYPSEHATKPVPADSTLGGQHDTRAPGEHPEDNPVPEAELNKPGPRPLDKLAKQRGGDAGNIGVTEKTDNPAASSAVDSEGPQKESHGEGTGEKYVKSSGFAAEGGDFDAANPGAGREADRLLEQHGQLPTADSGNTEDDHSHSKQSPSEEKKSLKEKIKAKLHRH